MYVDELKEKKKKLGRCRFSVCSPSRTTADDFRCEWRGVDVSSFPSYVSFIYLRAGAFHSIDSPKKRNDHLEERGGELALLIKISFYHTHKDGNNPRDASAVMGFD